jgi:hypothetical protein
VFNRRFIQWKIKAFNFIKRNYENYVNKRRKNLKMLIFYKQEILKRQFKKEKAIFFRKWFLNTFQSNNNSFKHLKIYNKLKNISLIYIRKFYNIIKSKHRKQLKAIRQAHKIDYYITTNQVNKLIINYF